MRPTRFLMIGGFLGAGKTTALAWLADHYIRQGLRVGLVTNDQADNLVDSHFLRDRGFSVGEVAGACFCCKFDDLVQTAQQLGDEQAPDVILAEPVGSCTDLVATVIEPLRQIYGNQFAPGPLVVLCKPEHGLRILADQPRRGFSPKAAYIFKKQLEEASVLAINKIDTLSSEELDQLTALLQRQYPKKMVLAVSARRGDSMESLVAALESIDDGTSDTLDLDYDIYADGEAELGWLNGMATLSSDQPFDIDLLLVEMLDRIRDTLNQQQAEIAHIKLYADAGDTSAVANLVAGHTDVELSQPAGIHTRHVELIINARVACGPEQVEEAVSHSLQSVASNHDISSDIHSVQRFRPGRPQPTHRLSK